jgi:exopolyphosphatase/guanosine-5'-triphosphate,3'-diphosphate pyrophosphatase
MSKRAAAIDIGTNSVKMVMGSSVVGGIDTVDVPPVVTRLGRGVDATGNLDPVAMGRTLTALKGFASRASLYGATLLQAVGTSALRDAANGTVFQAQAEAILGVPVEIISGEREADLIYRASCEEARHIAPTARTIVTTDVGGGSTEIVIGEANHITYRESLQIGAVRLTERTLLSDPPTDAEYTAAVAMADALLAPVPVPTGAVAVIASGGTAANLGAMQIATSTGNSLHLDALRERLHGHSLSIVAITEQITRLRAVPLATRRTLPGLEPDRADVIIAGAILQARILHHLQQNRLYISVQGLRYGLLYEMLSLSEPVQ